MHTVMPQNEHLFSFAEFIKCAASELMTTTEKLNGETVFREIDTWTSLNALLLISKLNDVTGVFLASSDLAGITTLNELYQLILLKQNGTK